MGASTSSFVPLTRENILPLVSTKYPILFIACLFLLPSCEKDDEPQAITPTLTVPAEYDFRDADDNSTVNFNGQAQRLEMLSEMVTYMKSANTSITTLDADLLKNMYANTDVTWADVSSLGMTGSSKQLKSKTAAAPFGIADATIQAVFESYIDDIATISQSQTSGTAGQSGVVVSTTNPTKEYLQSATGQEFGQLIEKGLMGAVFYNQITMNYLGDAEMASDNTVVIDPENGKYYTEMEHAWDEAYGYFTTAIDYEPSGNGTDRFWGKYADGREVLLGSATALSDAFRRGRAAISANDLSLRDEQITIIRTELADVVAGTAIHYLNGAVADFGDDALRNHQLSEAVAFIGCLPYGFEPIADQAQVNQWMAIIGDDFYAVSTAALIEVRDEMATAAGMGEIKTEL